MLRKNFGQSGSSPSKLVGIIIFSLFSGVILSLFTGVYWEISNVLKPEENTIGEEVKEEIDEAAHTSFQLLRVLGLLTMFFALLGLINWVLSGQLRHRKSARVMIPWISFNSEVSLF